MSTPRSVLDRLRNTIVRSGVLPAGDLLFRQGMMRRVRFLDRAQWWGRDRIEAFRDRALAELIGTAYREVPYYRERLDQAGVAPGSIRTPADLRRLPILTKADLRANYPDRLTRPTGFRTGAVTSSGSTGTNIVVLEDSETAGWYRATFLMSCEWTGWRIGDPHMQTGMTLKRSLDRRLKDRLLGCTYVSAYVLDDDHLDRALDLLDARKIRYLWGYPGSLYYLARRAAARGWNRPLDAVVTWGDNLYEHYRQQIEGAFQTRIYDQYGCGEGIQVAAQCGHGRNYHVHELDVVLELLDDEGRPVPDGQPGNVILTRLHPGPMPLIRYQVGDLAILSAGAEGCGCGRQFRRLHSIQGRDTDVVITPKGNRLIVHFFTGKLENFPEIHQFQVVQTEVDAITLRIVPSGELSAEAEARIVATLVEAGADGLTIRVERTDNIPAAASGKRRFVIGEYARSQALRRVILDAEATRPG